MTQHRETADALAEWYLENPEATLVAGATDVGLWVTKGLADLAPVAFLNRCADLRGITVGDTDIRVGAMTTITDLRDAIAPHHPSFAEMLRRYGSQQVRNAATLGGNIANGSPIGDSPPPLIALGATLHLRKGADRRSLPLEDFFLDYGKQDRAPGEFVEAVTIPRASPTGCASTNCRNASIRISPQSAGPLSCAWKTASWRRPASPLAAWPARRNERPGPRPR